MTSSNSGTTPSPDYVETVATAYRDGAYASGSDTFGDGRFSNLKAVVAAILLHREAASHTLDADPAYGGLKQPIVKVLQFMRSSSYVQSPYDRNIYPKFGKMVSKVGQMAYESPDQVIMTTRQLMSCLVLARQLTALLL